MIHTFQKFLLVNAMHPKLYTQFEKYWIYQNRFKSNRNARRQPDESKTIAGKALDVSGG